MSERLIYESENSRVFLRSDEGEEAPVVVKILNQEFPSNRSIRQFYNEYEMVKDLDVPGVRRVLDMGKVNNRHSLTLEYVEGITAKALAGEGPVALELFLQVAIQACEILSQIHQRNIVHKDLSAVNVIVDRDRGSVHLIDFGISSRIDLKEQHLGNPERLEGNLSYISPEQTGRMNRIVDYRTDLYSLGVTFYELLTGRLPFQARDAMELVHAHIAQTPDPVVALRPEVPQPLSDIVDRLLAKNAEERYQSALGLKRDLERCLYRLRESGTIEAFPLGQDDFSGRFRIPEKLYGREKDTARLLEAFDRVAGGDLETVLVAGYSGTGKSALVREIHKPITQKRGYFIEGKFDQFQRVVPYYAIIQAFQEFVTLLLTENEARLEVLRKEIQDAVGEEGKILTDVLPRLEHVIGPQPDVAEVGGTETQNRFNYVFRKFVKAISTADHPIVLFIDDLQWADSASLDLLRVLLTDPENRHLLCVCAYRDNEVSASHPFIRTVGQIEADSAVVTRSEIGNLAHSHVHSLVSDALSASHDETRALTDLVHQKTQGNAFFVTQFLKSLAEEGLLFFDFEHRRWTWEVARIREKNITENVVELMAGKIQKLPDATQEILKRGACVGNTFDLETLAVILERTSSDTSQDLKAAYSEGLVVPFETQIKFAHDRIQQAVYSLIPEEDRNALHLRIGRLLLSDASDEHLEEVLFDVVNQLNWGQDIITDPEERRYLAELNLKAGRKAKQSSAFEPAYEYLDTGISLLEADPWEAQYELALALFTEAAETAYYNGEFQLMAEKLEPVFKNARELSHKIEPYAIRINAYKAENKLHDAIDTGLEVLEQLGERFPKRPLTPLVLLDLAKTKLMLRGKDNDTLATLPEMTEWDKKAAMRILNDIASPAYWARPEILPFLLFRMVQLALKHGVTQVSSFGFPAYGLLMCAVLGDMEEGYRFGQLGLRILDRFQAKEWLAQSYTPIYALINHWSEHVHLSLEPFLYSYKIGFETGAIEYACVNLNIYCIHAYLGGLPLPRIEEDTRLYSELMLRYKQETNYNYNEVYRQAILNLQGRSDHRTTLTGDAYDEALMLAQNAERKDKTGSFQIHFNKTILCYLFHDFEAAREHADQARPLLDSVLAKFEVPNFWFYEAMAYAALAREREERALLKRTRKNLRQFRKWAKHSPDNHLHKLRLLEAEVAWSTGRPQEAREAFEDAVRQAASSQYMNEEALALERAGEFFLSRGDEAMAERYLNRAFQAYREWGAEAKQADLVERHPRFISQARRSARGAATLSTTTSTTLDTTLSDGSALDLSTLMKASTAISGEIVLGSLLKTLMGIVVENAGAQRGVLLLKDGDALLVQGEASLDGGDPEVLQARPLDEGAPLARSVVAYVARTSESLVVSDVLEDERFSQDEYVQESRPRSLLCMPILNQGRLTGILYMEHHDTAGAFSSERTELLRLLSGQIAISIENAQHYETLEAKVRERTAEVVQQKEKVEEALEQLRATQAQLVQSEKMASLGQLTAGIAHEIKNPLNFVNNFAALSVSLASDLKDDLQSGASEEEIDQIIQDLAANAGQIAKHGARASAIVRAMEEHAMTGQGKREPVDLNALLDQFVGMSYQGAVARRAGFHAHVEREYDEDLGPVPLVPQEMGRVFVNILNNAFDALAERSAASDGDGEARLLVRTRRMPGRVEIQIADNGPGIPDSDRQRIFEPFFTTKSTGDGHTGLGLSLSYDIVTQGHGGTLSVEPRELAGAVFSISLPLDDPEGGTQV
jgi:predicted ATPase/signal transduction histidine kinase